jgi:hypothetical protein
MKKPLLLFLVVLSAVGFSYAQDVPQEVPRDIHAGGGDDIANIDPQAVLMDSVSSMKASFGLTKIGGETYAGVRLQPEFRIGRFGLGLDVPLQVNIETKKLRTEEFQGGIEVIRMIRYASFGRKKADAVYIRAGDLYGVSLGYGTLINNYSNSPSFEARKFGVNFDFNVKHIVGVEGVYSDISGFNLLGVRPYVRPLRVTSIPIVRSLEIGGSFVTDKGTNADSTAYFLKQNGIQANALDAGITFLNTGFIKLMGYGQTSQLKKVQSDTLAENFAANSIKYDKGVGTSAGLSAKMNIASAFKLDVRMERLWYNDHYTPQFFDAIYEINKDDKILSLGTAKEQKGIYGNLGLILFNRFMINGALLLPDKVSAESPALVQMGLETKLAEKLTISAHYIKGDLANLKDAFKLDQRSLANATATYQIASFLYVGVDYKWTFAQLEDGTIEATDYFRPYFGLSFPLGGK